MEQLFWSVRRKEMYDDTRWQGAASPNIRLISSFGITEWDQIPNNYKRNVRNKAFGKVYLKENTKLNLQDSFLIFFNTSCCCGIP